MNSKASIGMPFCSTSTRKWLDALVATVLCSLSCTLALSVAAQVSSGISDAGVLSVLGELSPGVLFTMAVIPCGVPVLLIVLKWGSRRALKLYVVGFCLVALSCVAYITVKALWL